jgi:hypothetical protein
MSESLLDWDQVVTWLTGVSRLLANKFTRDRLVETCFARHPYSVYRSDYLNYSGRKVFSGRWGTVLEACKKILPLERSLRAAWSLGLYRGGRGHDRDGEGAVNLELVNEAISNPYFWAYLRMADRLGEALSEISGWSETCPCHGSVVALAGPERHRTRGMKARIGLDSCPLNARRAPECAAGELRQLLRRLLDIVSTEILLDPATIQCSDAQRQTLLIDFARAKGHIQLVMTTKLSHWEQLPHVLFGIAHHDVTIARRFEVSHSSRRQPSA